MSGNEVKIRIVIDKPGVDDGLKQTGDGLMRIGETATKSCAAAKPAIDSIGVSAKQTAAALRGVPDQFTDIVTALQGGQAPLTVLLQQGGQLKDMFGGIGPAASAFGGYIVGLINPATLAAGTIGALALAYSQGAEEQQNFTRTLILTGNAAGTTAGQLMDASRTVAASSGATQGYVAEVINAVVASGGVSVDVLNRVTKAAIDLERSGGPAAANTAKEFAALGDKPVEAVLKLNEKHRFLTASVFEQIKALADQGKESEAARIAQNAYADAIDSRVPSMVRNLGLVEKAWRSISDAGKKALDGILGIGREKTLEEQMAEAQKDLAGAYDYSANAFITSPAAKKKAQDRINEISNEIEARDALLLVQKKSQESAATSIKQISALSDYLSDQSNASKATKLSAELEKENKAFEAAVVGLEKNDANYIAALKAHNERVATIRENYAKGQKDPAQEALFARSEESVRIRKQLEDEIKEIEKANEKRARAQQIVTNYNTKADQTVERIARQNDLIGVSEREKLVREALYKVDDDALQVARGITEQVKDEAERKKALAAVEDGLAAKKLRVAEATRLAYDESHTFAAGWSEALTQYEDSAKNSAKTAQDAFSEMSSAMDSAIKTFVKTGKVDFASFGDAVIDTLIDIQMQSLKTNVLAPVMQSGGSWLSSLFGFGASSSINTGVGSGFNSANWGLTASAKGNVFSDAPDLHQYVNTVQSSPKVFNYGRMHAFANGGVFAEEDPEAVMPLARDANGVLGVRVQGGDGALMINWSMPVTIDARGADAGVEQRLSAAMTQMQAWVVKNVPGVVRAAQLRNRQSPTV